MRLEFYSLNVFSNLWKDTITCIAYYGFMAHFSSSSQELISDGPLNINLRLGKAYWYLMTKPNLSSGSGSATTEAKFRPGVDLKANTNENPNVDPNTNTNINLVVLTGTCTSTWSGRETAKGINSLYRWSYLSI